MQPCGGLCGHIIMPALQPSPPPDKIEDVRRALAELNERDSRKYGVWVLRAALPPALRRPGAKRRHKWVKLTVDDWLKIQPQSGFQPGCRAIGPIVSGAQCWVPARSLFNQLNAVMLRVFRRLPYGPRPGLWRKTRLELAPTLLPNLISKVHSTSLEPQPLAEWLRERPAERRAPLTLAAEMYSSQGLTKLMRKFKSFLKVENMLDAEKGPLGLANLCFAVPRLIQGPHDVTHVIAGPKIHAIMKLFKAEWHHRSHLYYASDTPQNLDAWLQEAVLRHGEHTVFWCDYTCYDASAGDDAWEFVESLYGTFLRDPDFVRVLCYWREPAGRCGDVKYQGGPMTASGRDDTAFANGVLNGIAMFCSACSAWYNIPLEELTSADLRRFMGVALIAVCGDDSLGFLPFLEDSERLLFLERLRRNISQFGFKAKAFASARVVDAVFLGHRPLRVGGRYFWARTVGRAIFKLGWQAEVKGDPAAHMTGVMDMHQICSPHVPVLSDIAAAWCLAHRGCKRTPVRLDPNKPWEWMTQGLRLPSYQDDTLEDFALAYSVFRDRSRGDLVPCSTKLTVQDILSCIEYCSHWAATGLPSVLDHWVLRHMIWVDEQ